MKLYSASWQAIMQLVRKGASWSGHERNCCFLNTGGRFASVSHISGLDFPDDGRAVAVSDWDQDGDLDLWFRNRTAPRLRLMLNQSSNAGSLRHVAFRLAGTKSNRDGIGAVVELIVDGVDQRLVRSVRAGEMFLSQSSKWVHFGLPENALAKSVHVLWPGGERSTYGGIEAGKRYLLKQGAASATPIPAGRAVILDTVPLATGTPSTGKASIVLPAPVPLPFGSYFDEDGSQTNLAAGEGGRLLVLWSAFCPHCKAELTRLAQNSPAIEILALCIDGNTEKARNDAKALIAETGFASPWGVIGAEDVERLQVAQEALFDSTPEFVVPLSLLLRPGNGIVAIYRGALPRETLSNDIKLTVADVDAPLRNLAPPFSGRWFTKPAEPAFLPNLIARRIQARYPEDALFYLHHAAAKSQGVEKKRLLQQIGRRHYSLAAKYASDRMSEKSDYHFTKSLEASPNNASAHNDFGSSLARRGLLKEGESHFLEALRIKPDFPLARKNLARARELLKQSGQK